MSSSNYVECMLLVICAIDQVEREKHHKQMEDHIDHLATLPQSQTQKVGIFHELLFHGLHFHEFSIHALLFHGFLFWVLTVYPECKLISYLFLMSSFLQYEFVPWAPSYMIFSLALLLWASSTWSLYSVFCVACQWYHIARIIIKFSKSYVLIRFFQIYHQNLKK